MSSHDFQTSRENSRLWHWLVALLIVAVAALRVVYLIFWCPYDLSPDEAHYWDWSRNLDFSYYSKGPLIAYLIYLGCLVFGPLSEVLTGSQMVAVRLPAVLCSSLMLISLYILTAKITRRGSLAFTVVACALTLPLVSIGAIIMTIDAPFTCCWGWALLFAFLVLFEEKRWAWYGLGIAVGLGILAKYTMVLFYPSLFLFMLFTPTMRRHLVRRGFWLSGILAVFCCTPIIIWNLQNDWVGFFHVRGQAGFQTSGSSFHPFGPLAFVATQFAVLLGFWFVCWVRAAWTVAPWRTSADSHRYLWWMSVPVFVFFMMFAFSNGGGQPNWPVTAYLSGFVLIAVWLAQHLPKSGRVQRRILNVGFVATVLLGALLTAYLYRTDVVYGVFRQWGGSREGVVQSKIRRIDPSFRLRGWTKLANYVDKETERLRQQGVEPVLAGDRWTIPGELGFYCRAKPQAYCFGSAIGDRHSQYDIWRPNPVKDVEEFRNRTFIYIGNSQRLIQSGAFREVEQPRMVYHCVNGHLISAWQIHVLRGYRGVSGEGTKGREKY